MDHNSELIKILIPAVGGQGGGVLTEWLVQAFFLEEHDVQAISLPGLSQRGGSTVYYLEACSKKLSNGRPIIYSQYPVPGDVDIILAQEFLELGRILELGYGSDRTIIISSTHRIYSTLEKLPIGSGIYSNQNLEKLAQNFSSNFFGVDVLDLAKKNGMDELSINAMLYGILAASDALPINKDSYLKSIEKVGVAVKSNMEAFNIGWEYIKNNGSNNEREKLNDPEALISEKLDEFDDKHREEYQELINSLRDNYPDNLLGVLIEAVHRLIDYQGIWYATKYIKDVDNICQIEKQLRKNSSELTEQFAKNLALWMSFEDGIRVADLKINSSRFKRIKEEMMIKSNQVFKVIDYLKPDSAEIYGLLPYTIVAPFVKLSESDFFKKIWKRKKPLTFSQKPVTTTFMGFIRLWFLTKFKRFRPYSYRFVIEHRVIDKYKSSVQKYAKMDYELGLIIARSGKIIKGYGNVRRRSIRDFNRFLDNIIGPIAKIDESEKKGFKLSQEIGEQSLQQILLSPDGIDKAENFAGSIIKDKAA